MSEIEYLDGEWRVYCNLVAEPGHELWQARTVVGDYPPQTFISQRRLALVRFPNFKPNIQMV